MDNPFLCRSRTAQQGVSHCHVDRKTAHSAVGLAEGGHRRSRPLLSYMEKGSGGGDIWRLQVCKTDRNRRQADNPPSRSALRRGRAPSRSALRRGKPLRAPRFGAARPGLRASARQATVWMAKDRATRARGRQESAPASRNSRRDRRRQLPLAGTRCRP